MSSQPELEDIFRMEAVIAEFRKTSDTETNMINNSKRRFAEKLLHMIDNGEWPPEHMSSTMTGGVCG